LPIAHCLLPFAFCLLPIALCLASFYLNKGYFYSMRVMRICVNFVIGFETKEIGFG